MNGVFLAIGALLPICLAGGALLGYAAVRFRVQGDPVAEQVNALLPQTQCGQRVALDPVAADIGDQGVHQGGAVGL